MPPKNFSAHFASLTDQGLKTLRFNNLQVLQSIDDVIDVIFKALDSYLSKRA